MKIVPLYGKTSIWSEAIVCSYIGRGSIRDTTYTVCHEITYTHTNTLASYVKKITHIPDQVNYIHIIAL